MFLLSTDEHFSFYVCSSKLAPSILHYTCTHGNNVSVGLSVWLCVCSFLLTQSILCGGMLVDQCVSEALICLAAVLLWVGRWDGYPYPPSGQPGMDEMWPWPSAERDQGINVFCAIPAVQLFFADMSNNKCTHRTKADMHQHLHSSLRQACSAFCVPEPRG